MIVVFMVGLLAAGHDVLAAAGLDAGLDGDVPVHGGVSLAAGEDVLAAARLDARLDGDVLLHVRTSQLPPASA